MHVNNGSALTIAGPSLLTLHPKVSGFYFVLSLRKVALGILRKSNGYSDRLLPENEILYRGRLKIANAFKFHFL